MARNIPAVHHWHRPHEPVRLEPMSIWPIIVMMMLATPAMLLAVLLLSIHKA